MSKDITNEQLFEIITKMYSDLDGTISNMNKEMQEGFKEVNSRVDGLENEVKKTNIKIDHEIMPKINACLMVINKTLKNWTELKRKYLGTRK